MEEPIALTDAIAEYVEHLKSAGKNPTTVNSYAADLQIALKHFGPDKLVKNFLVVHVKRFFESEHVIFRKDGAAKAQSTVQKTRCAFRQLLAMAVEKSYLNSLPIPAFQ